MSDLLDSLASIGISDGSGPPSLSAAIDSFQVANMSPSDIFGMASSIPRTVGGIPGIGSRIPGLGNVPIPGVSAIDKALGSINALRFGQSGEWQSLTYGDDLNAHHPKFKFLFKVGFYGFPGRDYYYYVHRCDKPKVRFVHQDVNYYNFRTRVAVSTVFEPLQITFLDEIGNSVNDFFGCYLKLRSGQGSGHFGIDQGWGQASSSKPYQNGYSETTGQRIIIEQIFANGTMSNRFIFMNPRIETFDFDELTHEDSNAGSMATIAFSYDAIECQTVYGSTIHSWGNVDLLHGGGTSGKMNGGSHDGVQSGSSTSVDGGGVQGSAPKPTGWYEDLKAGSDMLNHIPNALGGLVSSVPAGIGTAISGMESSVGSMLSSASDTVSQGIQSTLGAISSGANMIFGGGEPEPDLSALMDLASTSSTDIFGADDLGGTEFI